MTAPLPIDLGDGKTCFKAGPSSFHVDIVDWVSWYARYEHKPDAPAYQLLDDIRDRLEKETGVRLSPAQADAFLAAVVAEYEDVKKKQLARRTSPTSSA